MTRMTEEEAKVYWAEFEKKYDEVIQHRLTSKWTVGFKDRGLGHGDFGVILEEEARPKDLELSEQVKILQKQFVIECNCEAVANHLVEIHNSSLVK